MGLYSSAVLGIIILKAWLFVFPLILHLLLQKRAQGENGVQCQNINVAKLDHNFNRWYQFVYEIMFIMLDIIWKPIYFSFKLVYYLLWLPGRNMRKVIILDAMSKNKCSKIAPLFEIQHDVLFRRISVCMYNGLAVGTRAYYIRSQIKGKHKTWYSTHFP